MNVVAIKNMLSGFENAGVAAFELAIENGLLMIRHRTTALLAFFQMHANSVSEEALRTAIKQSLDAGEVDETLTVIGQFSHTEAVIHWQCQLTPIRQVIDEHVLIAPDFTHFDRFLGIFTWKWVQHELNEHFFRTIVENSPDIITRIDQNMRSLYINAAVEDPTGLSPEAFMGKRLDEIPDVPSDIAEYWNKTYRRVFQTGQLAKKEFDLRTASGERSFISTVVPEFDAQGQVKTVLSITRDITERKKLERELDILAKTDPLTALLNRRQFISAGEEELARARRYNTPFVVLLIDIDNFKQVNDAYGHAEGDATLVEISAVIRQEVRETDIAGRLGGDEFCIILINTEMDAAKTIAHRIRARIMELKGREAQPLPISASIGLAQWNHGETGLMPLIQRADKNMYEAKNGGKNAIFSG